MRMNGEKTNGFLLAEQLEKLAGGDIYPFHMPGHKRNAAGITAAGNPYLVDITEIEGFDNLHHPEGIIRESMASAAKVYGAEDTRYLVNGSTCGILAAILAAAAPGERILMARNSHKSACHALILGGCDPVFVTPEILPGPEYCGISGGILPERIRELLERYPDIRAVFITSPTYEGVVSDIRGIAEEAHRHGVPLIVDEAHGAHFPFGRDFPEDALSCGADVVIQSLHKTLPALTQTAVLSRKGRLIRQEDIDRYLSMVETSSPSYVLMASAERAVKEMAERGEEHLSRLYGQLSRFFAGMREIPGIRLLGREIAGTAGVYDLDPSKLVFLFPEGEKEGAGGAAFAAALRRKGIEPEMATRDICLLMTSPWDTEDGFRKLAGAVREIAGEWAGKRELPLSGPPADRGKIPAEDREKLPERVFLPSRAFRAEAEMVPLANACGRISAGFITLYPPGVPCLIPGERFGEKEIQRVSRELAAGLTVEGVYREESFPDGRSGAGNGWTDDGLRVPVLAES